MSVNLIQAEGGGGHNVPPYRLFPCSTKTVCGRLMKLSDFQYNYIGHHLKQFLVDSNLGCCHGNAFVKEHLGKISSFFVKIAFFLLKRYFNRLF